MVGKHVDTIVWVMFSGKDEHRGRRARLSLTASVVARNNVKAALWNSEIEAALFLNWEDSLPNMRYQNPHSGQRLRMGLAINFYFDPLLPNKVRKSLTFVGGFGKIGSGRLRARCSGRQRSSLTSPVRQNGSTMNTIVARYRTR